MDTIDIKIINLLRLNSRMNASDIANEVELSVSTVIERIKKLENNGYIKQFSVVLDYNKVGKDVMALMDITLDNPSFNDSFVAAIMQINSIVECFYLAGDFDYQIKIICESVQELEGILNQIKSIKGVMKTKTIVVLSTIKNDLSISL